METWLWQTGFTIQAELAKKGATLEIPPFIAGQNQLAGKTVRGARRLSNLSIHVERAIERIKNFKMLSVTLPPTLVPHSTNIATICSALTNSLPKLIK